MKQPNIKLYLDYANMLDSRNPVMALHCRIHYLQEFIKSIKMANETSVNRNTSVAINAIFKKIENTKKALKLDKKQEQVEVENYCLEMYKKIMKSAEDPKADKDLIGRKLSMMVDFIQILTNFGELSPEWIFKSIVKFHRIRN